MDAVTVAEEFIAGHSSASDAAVLRHLLHALHDGTDFDVHKLYHLNLTNFDLAIEVLNAWRIQRYYRGGAVVAAAGLKEH
jgi:hypothetical protein